MRTWIDVNENGYKVEHGIVRAIRMTLGCAIRRVFMSQKCVLGSYTGYTEVEDCYDICKIWVIMTDSFRCFLLFGFLLYYG